MKIFEVCLDVNKFQGFLWDTDGVSVFPYPRFVGTPIDRKTWPPGKVISLLPKGPKPDVWTVGLGSGAFAINLCAHPALEMFGEMAGELLPLPFNEETLSVFNILQCLDCLDEDATEWKQLVTTGQRRVVTPCIRASRLTSSTLFKSAHNPFNFYCWENEADPEYEFKACVEANGISGLVFEEVLVS